ncbi:NAD(P)H-hydrate dehydratase [Chelativorans salis]|uniref:Bifunctional NAD(P)H-hydrate repair enzyme n=1 Tax=Chelativorans salis TaxID=2978478 RepID=A0ABT2LQL7_9HYPH|nr:NAD(P)H-hydrate dehydratase [Chelativorans sp. EGI FJ00035]MCT7375484.1 NAD(P)H-hydrate dehydratase [Chelativorans sp. EGI FJ00035]
MHEILSPQEMGEADRLAAEAGGAGSYPLMLNAGAAVVAELLTRFADAAGYDVLCGPGNNGGDGYVIARLLHERGLAVRLWRQEVPPAGTDGARAADECPLEARPLDRFAPEPGWAVVDALFGAGLSKPVEGPYAEALEKAATAKAPVIAVDLPSGVAGDSGRVLGTTLTADLTVTFFRKKPGHLLFPGRKLCGETVVADVGIPAAVLQTIRPTCRENTPALWQTLLPRPERDTHKYKRGHVAVFSGPPTATGAARLAARGAARIGAGAVTVLSPAAALAVNAMHLTAIMLHRVEEEAELAAFIERRHPAAFVIGPGFGVGATARLFTEIVLHPASGTAAAHLVLDADAVTAFAEVPDRLFAAAGVSRATLVLTPHEGEFARLFPDLAEDALLSKLERARQAAVRAHAVLVLKGADTVIAAPDGRAAINTDATPYLATAGSGDVLAGMIAGLLGQGMPGFEAACAAVHLHAEAGRRVGPGLIAEDLPERLPEVLCACLGEEK